MSKIKVNKLIAELQKLSYDEGNVPISKIDIASNGICIKYNTMLMTKSIQKTVRIVPAR